MGKIFTIGHSAMTQQEFVARCRSAGIQQVVDIRSHPLSKWTHYDKKEMEGKNSWLAQEGIGYRWEPDLAGWSSSVLDEVINVDPSTGMPVMFFPQVARTAPVLRTTARRWAESRGIDPNIYAGGYFPRNHAGKAPIRTEDFGWRNQGQVDYAWFTALPFFREAIDRLVEQAHKKDSGTGVALMCTEFVWWKCHRAQVADALGWRHRINVTHIQPSHVHHMDVIGRRLRNYRDEVTGAWGPRAVKHGGVG